MSAVGVSTVGERPAGERPERLTDPLHADRALDAERLGEHAHPQFLDHPGDVAQVAPACRRAVDRRGHRPFDRAHLGHAAVSYTHLRAHETDSYLVCRLL